MSRTAPNSSCNVRQLPSIIVGENHADGSARKVLLELLPFFKENNYTFCFEYDAGKSLDETIKFLESKESASRKNLENREKYIGEMRNILGEDYEKAKALAYHNSGLNIKNLLGLPVESINSEAEFETNKVAHRELCELFLKKVPQEVQKKAGEANVTKMIISQVNQFKRYFADLDYELGTAQSMQEIIPLFAGIKVSNIKYQNIDRDLDRSATSSVKLTGMFEERDRAMAVTLENKEGPTVSLVGVAHLLGIRDNLSPEKKSNFLPAIIIGDPSQKYSNKMTASNYPDYPYLFDLSQEGVTKNTVANDLQNIIEIFGQRSSKVRQSSEVLGSSK